MKSSFADGSGAVESRGETAFIRILSSLMRLRDAASGVESVLDDTTVPGVKFRPSEDDSLVIAIAELCHSASIEPDA